MILRVPDYYGEFACIADRCKGSCCEGWEIDIDEPTREYYCGVSGAIGERLRKELVCGEDGGYCFRLSEDGRCPFLNEGNLCDIILALGEEALSEVCTDFPRFSLSYGHVMQRVLSISCEEVGRILFSRREPVTFVEYEPEGMADWEDEETDAGYIGFLEHTQTMAIALLQDRSRALSERVRAFLMLCERAQEQMNRREAGSAFPESRAEWERENPMKGALSPKNEARVIEWQNVPGDWYEAFDLRFGMLEGLEELGSEWAETKRRVRSVLTEEAYGQLRAEYLASESYDETAYEQLLVYFTFRYLMQAVYSYDLLAYGELAVSFTLMIRDLDLLRWSENGKKLGLDDRIATAHIFSREVEHSEENFERMREELLF